MKNETKWIPIEEKLPPEYEEVLVTNRFGDVMITEMVREHYVSELVYKWRCNYSDASFDYVTAWMPLPKPYKGGEKE